MFSKLRSISSLEFVVLRLHERGERIPLTIADFNREEGTIKLIYQTAGKTTEELETLNAGDFILDLFLSAQKIGSINGPFIKIY